MTKKMIVAVATSIALLLVPIGASASTTGTSFGSHVSEAAQTHGLSGVHNPGVLHRGASGWMAGSHH